MGGREPRGKRIAATVTGFFQAVKQGFGKSEITPMTKGKTKKIPEFSCKEFLRNS
jgi:hypothetical protein